MKLILLPLMFLVVFWIALSGHYTFLLLSLGAISIALALFISTRMDKVDREGHPIGAFSWRIITYYLYLLKEILISNIAVTRMILSSRRSLRPNIYRLPAKNMSPMEKVTYANSITLTPGTLTLEVEEDWLEVHSLSPDLMMSLQEEEMADQVRTITSAKYRIKE